jgi:hypothetical protein
MPSRNESLPDATITPRTESRWASSRSTAALIARTYAWFIVFVDWSGSSRVSTTMPSGRCSHEIMLRASR